MKVVVKVKVAAKKVAVTGDGEGDGDCECRDKKKGSVYLRCPPLVPLPLPSPKAAWQLAPKRSPARPLPKLPGS